MVTAPEPTIFPASFGQQRLWILDTLDGAGATYNVPLVVRIPTSLDDRALQSAFDGLLARHEPLRTSFAVADGNVQQVIHQAAPLTVRHVDLRGMTPDVQEGVWRQEGTEEAARPFSLDRAPLVRATCFSLGDSAHLLLITIHHIVFDGWSEAILLRDLEELYAAAAAHREASLPELSLQYADFAVWQRERHGTEEDSDDVRYWRAALGGAPFALALPADRRPNVARRFSGAQRQIVVPPTVASAVHARAKHLRTTDFVVLLTAFTVVLSRFTDQDDLVVGTPVTGRTQPELSDLVGYFVNTVPVRVQLDGHASGSALVAGVHARVADALDHQDTPLERVLAATRTDEGRLNLQVLFSVQQPPSSSAQFGRWTSSTSEVSTRSAKFELAVSVEIADRVTITAEYQEALFEAGTIDSVLDAYVAALTCLTSDAEQPVSRWALMGEAQRDRLLSVWSGRTVRTEDPIEGLDRYFDRIASRFPDRQAVLAGNVSLSYQQLRKDAEAIAERVRLVANPGDVVGVIVDRSADYIRSLLGILKAGCAYVPIDAGHPLERIRMILTEADVRAVVGRPDDRFPLDDSVTLLDPCERDSTPMPPGFRTSARDLAYVLFTSGSTGRPKGVAIEHGGIVRLVCDVDYVSLGPDERILHLSAGSFDLSTFEIWGALLNGGCVVVAPTTTPTFQQLGQLIASAHVTTMWLTSTLFNAVIDNAPEILAPVRQVLVGGEAVSLSHARRAIELLPSTKFINGYGPTEATVFATAFAIPRDLSEWERSVPIGRPLPGRHVFVLDRFGQLAPAGAPGELTIGGLGLARGYLNRPEETARAFATGAVPDLSDARVYRSGDLVRWRADGTLEFLGRRDGQVKLRGFRIELGEVEAALRSHSAVTDAVVTLKDAPDGSARLVAYVVTAGDAPSREEFNAHLRNVLPEYMVPSSYVALRSLPRSSSGKLDRRALPEPADTVRSASASPSTGAERRIATVFERVLHVANVGADDDFFQLGGHSLLAIQLFSEIEREFGVQLPLHRLGRAATVRSLAAAVTGIDEKPSARPGVVPLRAGSGRLGMYVPFSLGGDLLFCADLAAAVSPDVPVWGLAPPEDVDHTNLHALAAAMTDRLVAHAQTDRCLLVGYSFSGMLAYEIAVEIERRGGLVPLVAVIDTSPPLSPSLAREAGRPFRALLNLPYWLYDDVLASSPRQLAVRVRRKLNAWVARSGRVVGPRSADPAVAMFEDMYGGQAVAEEYRTQVVDHLRALIRHEPRRYRGRLVAYRARTRPLYHSFDPDLGWRTCVDGPLEIVTIKCHHDNVLRPPHIATIAHDLNLRIAAIGAETFTSDMQSRVAASG
jgi:amino acid adenylation domain-containing protein